MPKTDIQKLIETKVTNGLGYFDKRAKIERDNPELDLLDEYPSYYTSSHLELLEDRCKIGYEVLDERPAFVYLSDKLGEGIATLINNVFETEEMEHISKKIGYKPKDYQ